MPSLDSNGVKIHYQVHDETEGQGETVLCVMGLAAASNWWFPQFEALRSRYRLVVFDNRGAGESDAPAGPYTMAQMAEDAVRVLDAVGTERAHLMGISMGGMISQHVALEYGDRVDRMVLACTHAGGPAVHPPSNEVLGAMGGRPNAQADLKASLENVGWILFTKEYLSERGDELLAELLARAPRPTTPLAFVAQVMAIMGHNTRDRLGDISHPTLVITGDEDLLVPPENSQVLASEIPNAKLEVIRGVGHGFNLEAREAFNQAVTNFLEAGEGI